MKSKITEDEQVSDELSEKEAKKAKRKAGVERRKSVKKMDRIAKWSGFILLLIVMLVGFLLWVAGEIKTGY